MKIGDSVYVHGYVDEIRKDTVIIRNKGGYFGTDKSELVMSGLVQCKDCIHHRYEKDIPYCDQIDYGYGWQDDDFFLTAAGFMPMCDDYEEVKTWEEDE